MKLYTFKVALEDDLSIWRTIEMKGNQTLEKLHEAIFQAFDRFDPHLYSFYFGKSIRDTSQKYTSIEAGNGSIAQNAARARLDDLMLHKGRKFFYLFDLGDEWWHTIRVISIEDCEPKGRYPRIVKKHGQSPPQYPEYDDEDEEEDGYDEDDEDFDSLLNDTTEKFVEPEDLPVDIPWIKKTEKIIQAADKAAQSGMEGFLGFWRDVSQEKDHLKPLLRVAFLSFLSAWSLTGARSLFNKIMGMADIDSKVKLDMCTLLARDKIGPMFIIYSGIDMEKFEPMPQNFIEESSLYFCGHFIVQCSEKPKFKNLFNVFFMAPFQELPDALARDAIRWTGEISSRVKEWVLNYMQVDISKIFPWNHHHFTLGALDLLDEHKELFTKEETNNILKSAMNYSKAQVRKKGYELAAEILGIESIKTGLRDQSKTVRDFVKKCIDDGGRPYPKGKKKKPS